MPLFPPSLPPSSLPPSPLRKLQETNQGLGQDVADLKKKMGEFEEKVLHNVSSLNHPCTIILT